MYENVENEIFTDVCFSCDSEISINLLTDENDETSPAYCPYCGQKLLQTVQFSNSMRMSYIEDEYDDRIE